MENGRTVGGGFLSVLGCVFIVGLASCQIVETPAADSGGPSLRTVYKDRFPIGVALGGWLPGEYNSRELGLVRNQFDVVTPTNCMKMKRIRCDWYIQIKAASKFIADMHAIEFWEDVYIGYFYKDGYAHYLKKMTLESEIGASEW